MRLLLHIIAEQSVVMRGLSDHGGRETLVVLRLELDDLQGREVCLLVVTAECDGVEDVLDPVHVFREPLHYA